MTKPIECTLFDLIENVSRYTNDDTEAAAVIADLINTGVVRLQGKFAGARIDVSDMSLRYADLHNDLMANNLSPEPVETRLAA